MKNVKGAWRTRSEKGAATVIEYTLILPITIFVIVAVFYIGFYIYRQAVTKAFASELAWEIEKYITSEVNDGSSTLLFSNQNNKEKDEQLATEIAEKLLRERGSGLGDDVTVKVSALSTGIRPRCRLTIDRGIYLTGLIGYKVSRTQADFGIRDMTTLVRIVDLNENVYERARDEAAADGREVGVRDITDQLNK